MPTITKVSISLSELQDALRGYCEQQGLSGVEEVQVISYDQPRIIVQLADGALVESFEFRHRVWKEKAATKAKPL